MIAEIERKIASLSRDRDDAMAELPLTASSARREQLWEAIYKAERDIPRLQAADSLASARVQKLLEAAR